MMIAAPLAGKISDKVGAKWGVTAGMILMAIGVYIMAHFHLDTTTHQLWLPYIVTWRGLPVSSCASRSAITPALSS